MELKSEYLCVGQVFISLQLEMTINEERKQILSEIRSCA